MTELSRNLIAAARDGLAPDPAVVARVRAKIAAAAAAGTLAGSTAPAPASAAPPVVAPAGGLALKLGAALLAIGVITTLVAVGSAHAPAEAPRVVAATVETDEPREVVQLASAERSVPVAPVAIAPASKRVRQRVAARAPAAVPITLAREVELIDRAMLLLRKGAASAALEAVAQFERETRGTGQLAEDAAAIEIEARCRLDHDVSVRLAAFDRRWPSSAQRERLQRACVAR